MMSSIFHQYKRKVVKINNGIKKVRLCPLPNADHQSMSYMYEMHIMTGIGRSMLLYIVSCSPGKSKSDHTHMD